MFKRRYTGSPYSDPRTGYVPSNARRGLLGGVLLGLVIAAGWAGYETGLRDTDTAQGRFSVALQAMLDTERRALESEKQSVDRHLDALALRMGRMQAELLRLEALGERLVDMGKLDRGEFDFNTIPPQGGTLPQDQRSSEISAMVVDLDTLAQRIADRELKLDLLEDLLLHRQVSTDTLPAGRPVNAGWISSHYGWRSDPFTGKRSLHRGLDFVGKQGSEIVAVADGLVEWAANRSGYGKTVQIRHGNGYVTRYAHNSKLFVEKGDLVRRGQVIAAMGHSGRATGTHLHFEVIRDGKTVNPLKFVKAERSKKEG